MKTFICDVCKKTVQDPIVGRTYFHIEDHDLCESCRDALEAAIKAQMREKKPFSYDWYEPLKMQTITKAVQKGKF